MNSFPRLPPTRLPLGKLEQGSCREGTPDGADKPGLSSICNLNLPFKKQCPSPASGSPGWDEPGPGSLLQPPGDRAPPFQKAPTGKLAVHYIRNANAGDSGSRVPGVHFPLSQSEAFGGGRGAVGEQPRGGQAGGLRGGGGARARRLGAAGPGAARAGGGGCVVSPGSLQAGEGPGLGVLCLGSCWGRGPGRPAAAARGSEAPDAGTAV